MLSRYKNILFFSGISGIIIFFLDVILHVICIIFYFIPQ